MPKCSESKITAAKPRRKRSARARAKAKRRAGAGTWRCRAVGRNSGPAGQPDSTELDAQAHELRTAVAQRGVDRVLQFEANEGRAPREMPPLHPGYDVESHDAQGNIQRTIEVKALHGAWTEAGVGLTKLQFEVAQQLGKQYWLYVVEFALDDKRFRIHTIQDPYGKANRFLFDPRWV